MIAVNLQVRTAIPHDQQQIANLMFFESHVHRHLDWRTPLEWLGSPFYWVIEEGGQITAALACPQDPPHVAWVRLFTHSNRVPLQEAWSALWDVAQAELGHQGGATVAVIALQGWYQEALHASGFVNQQQIVMLEWQDRGTSEATVPDRINIRPMTPDDLSTVAELDAAAFTQLWQNSLTSLQKAYPQAAVATMAEREGELLGYQISTQNPFGAHLARLAVRPKAQRQGLATALVFDLITQLKHRNIGRLTVNTQSDNLASLALYEKIGFVLTEEQFPVFQFEVPRNT
jgi:ribosomal protein S18 acetylase RimI-like enzyme